MTIPTPPKRPFNPKPLVVILSIILIAGIYISKKLPDSNNYTTYTTYTPEAPTNSIPFPTHGTISVKPDLECLFPFSITTPDNNHFYYIKLKNINDRDGDIKLYLTANTTTEFKIPMGDYLLYYANGSVWYGEEDLFGAYAQYVKADDVLKFHIENKLYMGHEIILIKQTDGNLESTEVSKSEFFD